MKKYLLRYLWSKKYTLAYRTVVPIGYIAAGVFIEINELMTEPVYWAMYGALIGMLIGAHIKWAPDGKAERREFIREAIIGDWKAEKITGNECQKMYDRNEAK